MLPWFTAGTADSKREAKENTAMSLRSTAGIENVDAVLAIIDAAIDTLPNPERSARSPNGEAVSVRAALHTDEKGQPIQSLTIEVAIYRKVSP